MPAHGWSRHRGMAGLALVLALGSAAIETAVMDRRHASGIVAAILETFQCVNESRSDRMVSDDTDDSAHGALPNSFVSRVIAENHGPATR